MTIKRKPKPWASQKIFFDVVRFDNGGGEMQRRALFLCKTCRHLCEWDEESDAYRCVLCGRKLSTYGAYEIIKRYERQLEDLKKQIILRSINRDKDHGNRQTAHA